MILFTFFVFFSSSDLFFFKSNWYCTDCVEYEASLLRLIEKITNGCTIEIDVTGLYSSSFFYFDVRIFNIDAWYYIGTSIYYKPGFIVGGKVQHDCGKERSIGYFLEVLACLAPLGKEPLKATLTGITNNNDNLDLSVDLFRTVTLPNLRHVGIDEGLSFKILKRGAPPNGGTSFCFKLCEQSFWRRRYIVDLCVFVCLWYIFKGGVVVFECPIVKTLKPILLLDEGKIKRIRGIAYCFSTPFLFHFTHTHTFTLSCPTFSFFHFHSLSLSFEHRRLA